MLLAVDTCGAVGGVALGEPVGEEISPPQPGDSSRTLAPDAGRRNPWYRELAGKTFSERLILTVSEGMAEAGVGPSQLSGIVVVHGPGSFTGIRIGVSAAKGLSEAWGVRVIAISRLELLARQAPGFQNAPSTGAVAVLDAGRGEFFVGVYRGSEGRGAVCELETLATPEELAAMVAQSGLPVVICEAVCERVGEALRRQPVFAGLAELVPASVAPPTAIDALRVGAERFAAGAFNDVATLEANYVRKSETEMLARIAQHAAARESAASST
jgi:tRNA threonylcarbamoyladenosine biosynthesis protein TsaB